jgi:hypothetical protein
MTDLEKLARKLYRSCTTGSAPAWELLGPVTKSVWLERAQAKLNPPKPTRRSKA